MSIYSSFTESTFDKTELKPNMAYSGALGLHTAMLENAINDDLIFGAIIRSDIKEAYDIQNGTLLESEVEALHEEEKKNIFKTIAEAFKNLFAKIKAFIIGIINKIKALFRESDEKFLARATDKLKDKKFKKALNFEASLADLDKVDPSSTVNVLNNAMSISNITVVDDSLEHSILNPKNFLKSVFKGLSDIKDDTTNDDIIKALVSKTKIPYEFFAIKKAYIDSMNKFVSTFVDLEKSVNNADKKIADAIAKIEKELNKVKDNEKNADKRKNMAAAIENLRKANTNISTGYNRTITIAKELGKNNVSEYRSILAKAMSLSEDNDGKLIKLHEDTMICDECAYEVASFIESTKKCEDCDDEDTDSKGAKDDDDDESVEESCRSIFSRM